MNQFVSLATERFRKFSFIAIASVLVAGHSSLAATLTETNAGPLPASAQTAIGSGPLTQIIGNLADVNQVDMFQIRISDPATFSASTLGLPILVDDPVLYLFNSNATGIYAGGIYSNDDGASPAGTQAVLPASHPFSPQTAGLYFLAIGWSLNTPLDANGNPVFNPFTGLSGDVEGASTAAGGVASWTNDVVGRPDLPTLYSIQLSGSDFAFATAIPEPSTVFLIASTLLIGATLRRKRNR